MLLIFAFMSSIVQIVNFVSQDKTPTSKPSYTCLNGKDPATLTHKEILKEFSQAKCAPIVIVPGLLSSKLTVEINCEELQEYQPDLFNLCGWTHCSKKWYEFWKKVPDKEYLLWVPSMIGPMNILTYKGKTTQCWAGFAKLAIDFDKPIDEAVKEAKGFKVMVYGSSKNTVGKSNCGNYVVSQMSPSFFNTRSSNLFKTFFQMLNDMGYVAGLTYQVIPYDYRLPLRHNKLTSMFSSNISRLSKFTGKKVIILAHSLGNNNVYNELLQLDQEFKDKHIKSWIGLGAALTGVVKSAKVVLSGEPTISLFYEIFGLNFRSGVQAFNYFVSLYNMLPIDPFEKFKNEEWFQAVTNRMRYEKGELPFEESGFNFLPKINDKCSPDNFIHFSPECRLGLYNQTDSYVIKINDKAYYINQMKDLLNDYNFTGDQLKVFELSRQDNIIGVDNPGVSYIAIILRTAETAYQFDFNTDIWSDYKRDAFPKHVTTKGYGDGTVESNSLFILGLKWAYEYDKGYSNSKPIKFIDVCSTYNVKYDIYDQREFDKPYELLKNEFSGIECNCMNSSTTDDCVHEFLVQDKSTLQLYSNIFITNEIVNDPEHNKFIDSLDDNYLLRITSICPQIIPELLTEAHYNAKDIAIEV